LVQAHKVILAACSPLFRKILAHQKNQQNPLLYLKGIRLKELQAVLNFMYHGEVNVAQDSLNNFLAVAEELAVKGLTTDSQGSSNAPEARKKAVAKRKSVPQSHSAGSNSQGGSGTKKAKNEDVDDDQDHGGHVGGDGIDIKRIKAEPEPSGSGAQSSGGAMDEIGDDSYAGEEGADDFGDGEDFEGFAQYGEGQDFDDSLAGASGSGAGADGKGTHFKCRSFNAEDDEGFLDVSGRCHSVVWKYFLKNRLQARAKCILCGQILEIKGGTTTSLSRHLRKRHGNECTDIPLPEVGTRKPELALNKFVECETILSENSFEETQVGFSPKILPSETSMLEK
jgi:hypothetical protein